MIIEGLLSVIVRFIDLMFGGFELPSLPDDILVYISTGFEYITSGASLLANYVPLGYLLTLFSSLLIIDLSIMLYHLIMWIIKKIPFLGME